jgi:hypothetical protein
VSGQDTRDYYVAAPLPPSAYDPSAYNGHSSAEIAEARRRFDWEREARNQISLAWHALDVQNPQAALNALEWARFYIRALEVSGVGGAA